MAGSGQGASRPLTDRELAVVRVVAEGRTSRQIIVTPHPDGADIVVSVEGDHDRRFKIDDDDLNSPIVRMLVGAPPT
jgi:hypothetical protein